MKKQNLTRTNRAIIQKKPRQCDENIIETNHIGHIANRLLSSIFFHMKVRDYTATLLLCSLIGLSFAIDTEMAYRRQDTHNFAVWFINLTFSTSPKKTAVYSSARQSMHIYMTTEEYYRMRGWIDHLLDPGIVTTEEDDQDAVFHYDADADSLIFTTDGNTH